MRSLRWESLTVQAHENRPGSNRKTASV